MSELIAIYPGTFDPVTHGHTDLIHRASRLFDHVIVAVAANAAKQPLFSLPQRKTLLEAVTQDIHNVSVIGFDNLLVEKAREVHARIILRGLRAVSDFEYEFQLAGINRKLDDQIETVHLMPAEQYTYLSSSMVREIARLRGDISGLVHPVVEQALKSYYEREQH
ncbi:MAG: pantetheine-phosphate adenylyltransferase [Gammaproteobacteria bacterium]|nr:MAG: pantetheine-phosphate adenylyltransferase [Gammaproteobacteria bacterium]